jgi:cobalt/nickel transport protein
VNKTRKLWVGIGILALLSPLGVLLPALFNSEGAWGEWGLDKIQEFSGFVPEGMKRMGKIWKAPLSDYGLPGQDTGLGGRSFGYVIAAVIGVAVTAGLMYLLARLLLGKHHED